MAQPSPRLKRDLVASFAEVDGVAFVDVRDPGTGASFRFYDYEYQLALQLDGKPLDEVAAWAGVTYGLEITADGIAEFAGRLGELGFLERPVAAVEAPPPPHAPEPTLSLDAEWLQGARTTQGAPDAATLAAASGAPATAPIAPHTTIEDRDAIVEPPPAARPRAVEAGRRTPTDPSEVTEIAADELTELASDRVMLDPTKPAAKVPAAPSTPPAGHVPPWAPAPPAAVPSPVSTAPTAPHPIAGAGRLNGTADGHSTARAPSPSIDIDIDSDGDGDLPPPSAAPPRSSTPPAGVPERRQPPAPERVVMAPLQEEGSRGQFKAPPPPRATRRGPLLFVLVVLIVAAAGVAYTYRSKFQPPPQAAVVRVRVIAPKPTAVYRWFSTTGAVVDLGTRTVAFDSPGRLAEILAPGTAFEAGETLAKLQTAAGLEADLGRHQSRVAFYEQMRDSMKAADNQPELRQAELKLAEKKKLVDETRTELDKVMFKAPEPGKVLEALVKPNAQVAPKTTVLKWKGTLLHGDFTLDEEDFAKARALDFCRVEVGSPAGGGQEPRFVDCKLPRPAPSAGSDERTTSPLRKFAVGMPADAGLVTGQPLRLARLRYDGAFPLPLSAVVHVGGGDKVWVATPSSVAALRPVTIAETREEALVTSGLAVGDEVVVDPPTDLQDGAKVVVDH
jgi:hypothetical protein